MSRRLLADTFVGLPARRLPPGFHHPGPLNPQRLEETTLKAQSLLGSLAPGPASSQQVGRRGWRSWPPSGRGRCASAWPLENGAHTAQTHSGLLLRLHV